MSELDKMKMASDFTKNKLISEFVNDLKEAKKGIGGHDTLVTSNDIYKLIEKYEEMLK